MVHVGYRTEREVLVHETLYDWVVFAERHMHHHGSLRVADIVYFLACLGIYVFEPCR